MGNIFKEKVAEAAPAEEERVDPLALGLEAPITGVMNVLEGVAPGAKMLQAKALGAIHDLTGFGPSTQDVAKEQARLESENPGSAMVGKMAGAGLLGSVLPGAGEGAGLVEKALVSGGQAAMLTPAYKLGETANEAQQQTTPLRVEQVAHSLFNTDTLKESLLGFVFGAGGEATLTGLEKASPAVQKLAANYARTNAGKFFQKVAPKLGATPEEIGELALREGLLDRVGAATSKVEQAGKRISELAKTVEAVPETLQTSVTDKLMGMIKANEYNGDLAKASKYIARKVEEFQKPGLTGEQANELIKSTLQAARTTQHGQVKAFLNDAAHEMRQQFAAHLGVVDPVAGAEYNAAVSDYKAFSKMAAGAEKGASRQASALDLLLLPVAGPVKAGAKLSGLATQATKSYAALADRFATNAPFAHAAANTARFLRNLLNPATEAAVESYPSHQAMRDDYDQTAHIMRATQLNPQGTASHIRTQLNFLPGVEADAVAAKITTHLADAAQSLPQQGPQTAFGQQTEPTDQEKRKFLEHQRATLDPYWALSTGRSDLIMLAEKHNPATVQHLRSQLIQELAKRKDIPYAQRRRLSAILGAPGTPLQDPLLGAQLQQHIQTTRQNKSQQGQMNSARQVHASMKQDKEALTRAQRLVEAGNEQ